MNVLNVISMPYSSSGLNNISVTEDSRSVPDKIKAIYENHRKAGVCFLKENSFEAELDFENFDENGNRTCFLGGDNSISYHAAKSFCTRYKNLKRGLIALDAHPDLCKKGKPKHPYHSDWLRYLIEEEIFASSDVLCVGWRDVEAEERDFARKIGMRQICLMSALRQGFYSPYRHNPKNRRVDDFQRLMAIFCENFDAIYLSIDFDVIDPAFAPGVNTLSPGGMTSGYFIELIKILSAVPQIKMFDITEVNPVRDVNQMTQLLALKTMIEMA
ncbi:hypothetical protein A3A20_01875 [Candidatus Wolfebacteria bacterium RIFCSPLOWO2_01_FULL_45_19]|uniref:Arginase n=1 Tax=Candidatus Wolfebacteria bacterium RIFCSPLOWO2_01_FULL_45_19 TaxID=1802557 RepID=A0A1F8DV29_9BACT|nr:MAG: Arginase [Parcubacteria group bacterium GW2011_GWB1_45_9]OGM91665.1 MAG: hypothetical protein A3A20_01875 [Candidatus Wolfebacteria bacterium RIFCSPLOWO2_01_FULL_45_19]